MFPIPVRAVVSGAYRVCAAGDWAGLGWGESAVCGKEGPGEKEGGQSAPRAVREGERDPAVCAHIHPTSSRKLAVAVATVVMGRGAAAGREPDRAGEKGKGTRTLLDKSINLFIHF